MFNIDENLLKLAEQADNEIKDYFKEVERICTFNSKKVLKAFIENRVSYQDFEEINGYGFFSNGRDRIEKVFADILGAEDALVRPQIMSGTNAIWLSLSGLLHYGDTMVAISGTPYDPLQNIVGTTGNSVHSLMNNGIKYEEIDLAGNEFDIPKITQRLKRGDVKLVEIQRSRGYSHREGLSIKQIENVCKEMKSICPDLIVFVDNCYGELVEEKEPTEVGADIIAGSLMHNIGGGIATSGGYIAGRADLIEQIAERLTAPCIAKELGADYNQNIKFLKGIYFAPQTVCNAVKTAIFGSYMFEKLGYNGVSPKYTQKRSDIIQTFDLESPEKLIAFCTGMQHGSPIDSFVTPIPCDMPGYPHAEIMSAGCFANGSTIELSCDGPMVEPYTAFIQGGLTYEYGKLGILIGLNEILKNS